MNTVTERPAALEIPTLAGTPFAGGFYAGRFFIGGQAYALIVAPKAEGELEESAWTKSRKRVAGATSYCDGLANTEAMLAAGSGLAKWARGLRIGGFDDWHLPSRLQALVMYGELSTLPDFQEPDENGLACAWYWTSTQHAEDDVYAWYQSFSYGGQYYGLKLTELRARAVRMIRI
jgi:hypothetical protein